MKMLAKKADIYEGCKLGAAQLDSRKLKGRRGPDSGEATGGMPQRMSSVRLEHCLLQGRNSDFPTDVTPSDS